MSGWSDIDGISAYWAGFMMADGYFYRKIPTSKKASCMVLQLAEKDKLHVLEFLQFLDCKSTPYSLESNGFPAVRVDIYKGSESHMEDLENSFPGIHITPKKWTFSGLQEDLKLPFLAGFIDGDGSVIWESQKAKAVQLFGEEELFVSEVKEFLNLRFPPLRPGLIKTNVTKLKNGFIFRLQGPRAAQMVEEVSEMKLPLLKRKWDQRKEAT